MYDVFFYESFEEETAALKRYLPSNIRAAFTASTVQEAGDARPPAALISTRTQSRLPVEWGDQLSGILTRSTGYDHILSFRQKTGVAVAAGYLPLYCHRAVAEQAMVLWMSLMRKLPVQIKQFSRFDRDGLTGLECQGKTLVVVGVGNIGSEIVKIGTGLGMRVLGVDIVERHNFVHYVSIEEALPRAHIIVCAMNLTSDNVDYFNYRRLKATPRNVIFVNIARGEMSPSTDLLRLIQEGHLGGVGLDVYIREDQLGVGLRSGQSASDPEIKATLKLARFPNVILTPHNAFNTAESVERKAQQSIQQIEHFLKRGAFIWPAPENS